MELFLKSGLSSEDKASSETTKTTRLFLRPDETKKSVFWLDLPGADDADDANKADTTNHHDDKNGQQREVSVPAPVEGIITRRQSAPSSSEKTQISVNEQVFAWGGMQVMSNAKAIEIYYTPPEPKKETYLTTIKGIPAPDAPNLYKALCAVPGGPRGVVAVRLKFLSLQPPSGTALFRLATLKWTARTAPPATAKLAAPPAAAMSGMDMASTAAAMMGGGARAHAYGNGKPGIPSPFGGPPPSNMFASAQQQSQMPNVPPSTTPPPLTKEDVGAAMAGMSFAMRSTEERMTKQIQNSTDQQQQYWQVLSQQLQQQSQCLQYQNVMMQRQQGLLTDLTEMIQKLQVQQERMNESLEQLQQNLAIPPRRTNAAQHGTTQGEGCDDASDNASNASSNWLRYASMNGP